MSYLVSKLQRGIVVHLKRRDD